MSFEDSENQAIFSLITGLAGMMFTFFAIGTILEPLGPLGGIAAVSSGINVLRGAAANKKLAVTGTVCGTIAVVVWVISVVLRMTLFVWRLF